MDLAHMALELDPHSPILGTVMASHYSAAGLYSLAEQQSLKTIELNPDFGQGYANLAFNLLTSQGRVDDALAATQRAIELDPENLRNLMMLSFVYGELGDEKAYAASLRRLEDLDAEHMWTAYSTVWYNSQHGSPAGTREAIKWALPKMADNPGLALQMAQVELLLGDAERALEITLATRPGYEDPEQWEELIARNIFHSCITSWLMLTTGDAELGKQLLLRSTAYLDEDLPSAVEHVDIFAPEVCYLTDGDKEKALNSIETQLAHGHLAFWQASHQMPMYDQIRDEPRYQAAWAERERRLAEQRERLAEINAGAGP